MDLSPFMKAGELIAVHVRERTISGGMPGDIIRCVLELEWASGERKIVEYEFNRGTTLNLASFEALIRVLNQQLARRARE